MGKFIFLSLEDMCYSCHSYLIALLDGPCIGPSLLDLCMTVASGQAEDADEVRMPSSQSLFIGLGTVGRPKGERIKPARTFVARNTNTYQLEAGIGPYSIVFKKLPLDEIVLVQCDKYEGCRFVLWIQALVRSDGQGKVQQNRKMQLTI